MFAFPSVVPVGVISEHHESGEQAIIQLWALQVRERTTQQQTAWTLPGFGACNKALPDVEAFSDTCARVHMSQIWTCVCIVMSMFRVNFDQLDRQSYDEDAMNSTNQCNSVS